MHYFSVPKLALTLVGVFLSLSAGATQVTFNFSALVTANNISGSVPIPAVGSTFSGAFTIDTGNISGVGSNCVGGTNCWSDSATSWSWDGVSTQLGGTTTVASLFKVEFGVFDSVAGSGQDKLTISLRGDFFTSAFLTFTDSSGSAFESATTLIPSLGSFDSATYKYFFVPTCNSALTCALGPRHNGNIIALSPAVVPLPAAAWLLGSALLGLAAMKRKRAWK